RPGPRAWAYAPGRGRGRRTPRPAARPPRPPGWPAGRGRCRAAGPGRGRPRRGSARVLAADDVEGAARREPLDLLVVHGVGGQELDRHAVRPADGAPYRLVGRQVGEPEDADAVVLADLVVGRQVGE